MGKKGIKVKIVPEAWLFGNMEDGQGAERWKKGYQIGGKYNSKENTIYIHTLVQTKLECRRN